MHTCSDRDIMVLGIANSKMVLKISNQTQVSSYLDNSKLNMSYSEFVEIILNLRSSSAEMTMYQIGVCVSYSALFAFGLLGNVWVITTVFYIFLSKNFMHKESVFIFVCFLSVADILVLFNIPFLIAEIIYQHWAFGQCLCKLYWLIESANKMLSTFTLTTLSFERYISVCHPSLNYRFENTKMTVRILISSIMLIFIMLVPILFYAQQVNVDEDFVVNNVSFVIATPKCSLSVNPETLSTYVTTLFAISFCLPSIVIAYSYAGILYFVFCHRVSRPSHPRRSQINFERVKRTVCAVVVFHFVCWTPFWVATMYASHNSTGKYEANGLVYTAHVLVYTNSSFNWIFYAFLNRHLHESRRKANVSRNNQANFLRASNDEYRAIQLADFMYDRVHRIRVSISSNSPRLS